MYVELAILALFIFLYSIVAGRVERSAISGPMVFVIAGFLMGPFGMGWFDGDATSSDLRTLADLTLALILFIDAANADLSILKRQFRIPSRMLLIGLPGVIALGFGLAVLMFDSLSLYEAAILATMLAATDDALGKAVITNKACDSLPNSEDFPNYCDAVYHWLAVAAGKPGRHHGGRHPGRARVGFCPGFQQFCCD